ncbi:MAG TPA: ABC transporter permease [Anaerolineales bacterium]|nr:ABC transporter permease [Anaerolineales bacterium]
MTTFLIRRVLQGLLVLFFSSIIVFLLLYLAPGGPLSEIILQKRQSARYPVRQEDIDRLKKQYDLDLPMWQAYTRWAFGLPNLTDREPRYGVIRGDFGKSWRISEHEQTMKVILRALPNTLKLTISSVLLSLLIGVPVGIYSAVHQYSKLDYTVTTATFFGTAMPVFWLGTMLILLFAFKFKEWGLPYLPPGSVSAVRDYTVPMLGLIKANSLTDQLLRLILPTITLSLLFMAGWSRYTRSSMLEVLRQDYVRTARAKGLHERFVISRHALRNALIPLVTIVTLQLPFIFGGAVITETIFNWHGMGLVFIDSLFQSDWPVAMTYILILSALTVASNLFADVLYTIIDPRIRVS